MKQLSLMPSVGVALALHAGAIAVAWLGQAATPGLPALPAQTCQAVALERSAEQSWPERPAAAAAPAMPRPATATQPLLTRPQGDVELTAQPEVAPPLPDPQPELTQADLPWPRLLRPAEQPLLQPDPPKQQPAALPGTATAAADQPAAIWVAPRILHWQAPEKVRAGFHGQVVALLTIDEQGQVAAVELDKGTGNQAWDALLLKSFENARCLAATCNSKPARGVLRQPVDFP